MESAITEPQEWSNELCEILRVTIHSITSRIRLNNPEITYPVPGGWNHDDIKLWPPSLQWQYIGWIQLYQHFYRLNYRMAQAGSDVEVSMLEDFLDLLGSVQVDESFTNREPATIQYGGHCPPNRERVHGTFHFTALGPWCDPAAVWHAARLTQVVMFEGAEEAISKYCGILHVAQTGAAPAEPEHLQSMIDELNVQSALMQNQFREFEDNAETIDIDIRTTEAALRHTDQAQRDTENSKIQENLNNLVAEHEKLGDDLKDLKKRIKSNQNLLARLESQLSVANQLLSQFENIPDQPEQLRDNVDSWLSQVEDQRPDRDVPADDSMHDD